MFNYYSEYVVSKGYDLDFFVILPNLSRSWKNFGLYGKEHISITANISYHADSVTFINRIPVTSLFPKRHLAQ